MAFLKGDYDPSKPPGTSGPEPAAPDDLQFSPNDVMPQNDVDDVQNMLNDIGGDIPEVERSSIAEPAEEALTPAQ